MHLFRKVTSLVTALGFCASVANASSPTPPIVPHLESDGPGKVRIVIATTASGDYAIKVRKTGVRPVGEAAVDAKPLTEGIVRKDGPVIVSDEIVGDAAAGDVVHVNYEVEVVNKELDYRGFMAVDQAFAVESDGTLRAITFEEELARTSGPEAAPVLGDGEVAADGPSAAPRQ